MVSIIGVRFRPAGKIYYFDPLDFEVKAGDHVIVETARGVEYGLVVLDKREISENEDMPPLKPIIRMATDEDEQRVKANKEKEKDALAVCRTKVEKHGLDMKLIGCEYTFDNSKLLFYFTADGRVDFRELVKDLATVFHTRIELRQIGVRDETKLRGGIGICGRELCCHTYLSDFIPVSVKMAKEQNLSLNPTKISGNCGRLMCCLKHEEDAYEYLNSKLPNIGDLVHTPEGLTGEVSDRNVLKQKVKVLVHVNGADGDEKELREYKVEELKFRPKKPRRD
ncbi:MAG: stage 0 sporulation family protein, partial [Lachnospiraceae bacterium]|nr:stage 0 sporulation family protein [Lachnospiraceae bacterium]